VSTLWGHLWGHMPNVNMDKSNIVNNLELLFDACIRHSIHAQARKVVPVLSRQGVGEALFATASQNYSLSLTSSKFFRNPSSLIISSVGDGRARPRTIYKTLSHIAVAEKLVSHKNKGVFVRLH
jgi:hypothetical protein